MKELVVDNFAGGGGTSLGLEWAGLEVDIAVNHDELAVAMYRANHPGTQVLCENIWQVDPAQTCAGRRVGLAWFSPDCTHFSKAKGGAPVSPRVRGLAWVVIRWAKAVRPRVIILENVEEFASWGPLGPDMRPCSKRKGQTFKAWVGQLRRIGYAVEWRELRACDYGAPTIRRRLFLIARCDGLPISWPEPTHGPGRRPYRTAAECIDWTLPCPSIFTRKRPLAQNTLRRIANGIRRYVLEAKEPFIVCCNHGGPEFRGQPLGTPLKTVTAARDAVGLVVPSIARIGQTGGLGKYANATTEPLTTVTSKAEHCLVSAFLAKHFGGHETPGACPAAPMSTVTAKDHHALAAAHLVKLRGTCKDGQPVDRPAPTITGGGTHVAEVRAFLTKYYQTGAIGQTLLEPMHTVTAKHRLGLVTVAGEDYQIIDIGMRMLTPRELARAQGFPDSYILTGSKANQVAKIGNSVCPVMAKVLAEANYRQVRTEVA